MLLIRKVDMDCEIDKHKFIEVLYYIRKREE